jgi:hypothetical protein
MQQNPGQAKVAAAPAFAKAEAALRDLLTTPGFQKGSDGVTPMACLQIPRERMYSGCLAVPGGLAYRMQFDNGVPGLLAWQQNDVLPSLSSAIQASAGMNAAPAACMPSYSATLPPIQSSTYSWPANGGLPALLEAVRASETSMQFHFSCIIPQ